MGVPAEAPAAVHEYWANIPNCAEIWFLFKPWFGPTVRIKCEGWGQIANDSAATEQAFYYIRSNYIRKRPISMRYVGWEEIGGERKGNAPSDFYEQYRNYWKKYEELERDE